MWEPKTALIVVDMQKDFCPGGALPVAEGDSIIPDINRLVADAMANSIPIFFTKDWHPATTTHFDKWPPHCVQGTSGAMFHDDVVVPFNAIIIKKGTSNEDDGYSPFEGRDKHNVFLDEHLRNRGIRRLIVCGLATDYCVKACVEDGLANGYMVEVGPTKGVEKETSKAAIDEMKRLGATFVSA